jgi:hypothetical protein
MKARLGKVGCTRDAEFSEIDRSKTSDTGSQSSQTFALYGKNLLFRNE